MNIRVITAPTVEPITLEQALLHVHQDAGAEDALVTWLISAARDAAEQYCNRYIAEGTYEARGADFCVALVAPVASIVSVKYLDTAGAEQTLADSVYEFNDEPDAPAIRLKVGQSWPATYSQADAVRVQFTAGQAPEDVPKSIFAAMLLTLGHLYVNREDVGTEQTYTLPMGARTLLQPYRLSMGV